MKIFALASILLTAVPVAASDTNPAFQEVLIPIRFSAPVQGAFGTSWTMELWVRNDGDSDAIVTDVRPLCEIANCSGGPVVHAHTTKKLTDLYGPFEVPATVLHVEQSKAANLHFSARLQEQHHATTGGTELPVVREAEFRTGRIELLNIPVNDASRIALRVYDPRGTRVPTSARVTVYDFRTDAILGETTVELQSSRLPIEPDPFLPIPAFAQIPSLTEVFSAARAAQTLRVVVTPDLPDVELWAFASITDNVTQQVSLVTPQ